VPGGEPPGKAAFRRDGPRRGSFLFPEIEPFETGMLPVGDGHSLYWERCGNPRGRPAVVLHGGPGSGSSANARRYFDPDEFCVLLFDQRAAGRSTPSAGEAEVDLSAVTLPKMVRDIETLRQHFAIERWLVLGGSWGSTLALAYAQRHPGRVEALVLYAVATTTAREIDWITRGVGAFFPEEWERLLDGAGLSASDGGLVDAYHRLLMHGDPAVRERAARDWCDWEAAIVAVRRDYRRNPKFDDPRFRLGFARLVTHVWRHRAWLEDDELLRGMPILAAVPGRLIHGRLDLTGPLITPWRLHRAWPASTLHVLASAGHDSRDDGMSEAIVGAVASFASRPASRRPTD
jgi:proline iminopeptidase